MEAGSSSGGSRWRVWGAVAAVILFAIFMLQNSQQETIDFFFWDITAPLIFSLLVSMLVGVAIGFALTQFRGGRRKPD